MADERLDELRSALIARLKDTSSEFSFKGFFGTLSLERGAAGELRMVVPSQFVADRYEGKYRPILEELLVELTGGRDRTFVVVCREAPAESAASVSAPRAALVVPAEGPDQEPRQGLRTGLNPKYTMESFVVGEGNRFAHAVSLAIVASPGDQYNPLFLYGGVGLGKTHLMQAVAHKLLENGRVEPGNLSYVTAEYFCNEYIQAIQDQSTDSFRRKYRRSDVFLIDDVQFFVGKEKLQEEFFHTFNELYQAHKQIVMTSDRPPAALEKLQERLVDRFQSGVTADIKAPDLETRTAILKRTAEQQGVSVGLDCLTFIAERVTENIRKLEGAFTKVVAMASFMARPITIPMIEEVLSDFSREKRVRKITVALIQEKICEHYSIQHDDLVGKRRTRQFVTPRQVAMYLCKEMTEATLQAIGNAFGGKDHTTVLHACSKVAREIEEGSSLAEEVKMVRIKLRESMQG